MMKEIRKRLFNIKSEDDFNEVSLELFHYQAVNNPVYSAWLHQLELDHATIDSIEKIPFMPISLFRDHKVIVDPHEAGLVFTSSGTGGMRRSSHYVADAGLYERSYSTCFSLFYGDPRNYVILALLPSYLERKGSSLVYMAEGLIKLTASAMSGFFQHDFAELRKRIPEAKKSGRKILLLGVSFALLDLAAEGGIDLEGHRLMETGGMKGRKEEITRRELHEVLSESFKLQDIDSEYGMTELLSQAYSKGKGVFYTPPWMRVVIRDPHDPFSFLEEGRTGGINIIDLANVYSCSFIETSDLGVLHPGGGFEVTGRFDNSDIRGCNLLMV